MNNKAICAFAVIAGLAAPTLAAPTLFATSGSILYRIDLGNEESGGLPAGVEQFELGAAIVSMTYGAEGELWMTGRHDLDNDGNYALYSIDNPFGTPVLTERGDFISGLTSSIVNIDGALIGYKDSTQEMIEIDPLLNSASVVGSYAAIGSSPASSGYDSSTGRSYGIRHSELFEFVTTESGVESSNIATIDFGALRGAQGGEIIDGVYYHAIIANDTMHIFSIDLENGESHELVAFGVEPGSGVSLGLTGIPTVPAPGSVALLGLGGFVGLRRRR